MAGRGGPGAAPAAPREHKLAQRLLTGSVVLLGILVLLAIFGLLPIGIVQLANVTGAAMIALAIAFLATCCCSAN